MKTSNRQSIYSRFYKNDPLFYFHLLLNQVCPSKLLDAYG